MALLWCRALPAAALDVLNVERFDFAALDLCDCSSKLIVFALALPQ
jgi:hypothetical protein